MQARLVRPDATTAPVNLPASPTETLAVMYAVMACDTVDVVRVIRPGPGVPGVEMGVDDAGLTTENPVLNFAAGAIVALLSRRRVHQAFAGAVLFTGGPTPDGSTTPLDKDYDEVIARVAAAVRAATAGVASRPHAEGGQE